MWKGRLREQWDMVALLRRTLYETGMSRPKKMPTIEELNPIRGEEAQQNDTLIEDIERALIAKQKQ